MGIVIQTENGRRERKREKESEGKVRERGKSESEGKRHRQRERERKGARKRDRDTEKEREGERAHPEGGAVLVSRLEAADVSALHQHHDQPDHEKHLALLHAGRAKKVDVISY